MIGVSWTAAPIQTYFGVEGLLKSADAHAGPATAPVFGGAPHETVILIRFSPVGNPPPIVTENVPIVVGRVVQVLAAIAVRSVGWYLGYWTSAPRSRIACLTCI